LAGTVEPPPRPCSSRSPSPPAQPRRGSRTGSARTPRSPAARHTTGCASRS
jgi:hypothetical protein